jgi:DNA-binding Xre family transcriptional regulator
MKISYKKLWHLLLDKNMTKLDLRKLTGISTTTVQKLTKDESVGVDILLRICEKLDVRIEDIIEFVNL